MFATDKISNVFIAKCRLIPNAAWCDIFEDIPIANVKDKNALDEYRWRCRRPFTFSKSIRSGSCIKSSRYTYKDLFVIFYKYIKNETFNDIAYETNRDSGNVGLLTDLACEIICDFVFNNNGRLGGINTDGSRKVVEIDESLFFNRKYNRGNIQNEQWYVGLFEIIFRKCFIVPVLNRNAETMSRVIIENVLPGTNIITDQWRAYTEAISTMPQIIYQTTIIV